MAKKGKVTDCHIYSSVRFLPRLYVMTNARPLSIGENVCIPAHILITEFSPSGRSCSGRSEISKPYFYDNYSLAVF